MECDWLKCDVCKRDMMDRCEWANENGESAFWELDLSFCFKNVKRFGGRVVKTLRCGRRITGSNPGRGVIFFFL